MEIDNKTLQAKSNKAVAINSQENKGSENTGAQFEDNRPEVAIQRRLQSFAVESPNSSSNIQLQAKTLVEEGNQESTQKKENNTGLPDNLKTGIENLSGYSMDDVKVHSNSDKPSELNAHAYAQGTDIHLAPGQEQHLPHEAWHVAQQKQGRVKPTKQLKGETNINDDAGLEREADLMGAKAAGMQLKAAPNIIEPKKLGSDTAQLEKATDISEDKDLDVIDMDTSDEFDMVEEHQSANRIEKESNSSIITDKALDNIEGDKGASRKIELDGELSVGVRLKSLFGKKSTYTLFLEKAKEFNESEDVKAKQSLLQKDLKPLARQWLERHEEEIQERNKKKLPQDQNELLKFATIQKFLQQTTSNQPQIIEYYNVLEKDLTEFRANPISKKAKFSSSVEYYRKIKLLKAEFKQKYPPSLNILYVTEMLELAEREKSIIKRGSIDAGDFDTKLGFTAKAIKAEYNLNEGTVSFMGDLAFDYKETIDTSGNVKIIFDDNEEFQDIKVIGANCIANVGQVKVKLSGLEYEYSTNTFRAKKGKGELDLLGTPLTLDLYKATYQNGEFDFDKLVGTVGEIDTGLGIKLTSASVVYSKGHVILLEGQVAFSGEPVEGQLNAKVTLDTTDEHKVRKVKFSEGNLEASALGLKFTIENISYNSSDKKINAEKASGTTEILGSPVSVAAENISYAEKKGFDVEKAKGQVEDEFGGESGIKIKNPSVTFIKNHVILIQSKASLSAFGIDNATGDVTFAFDTTAKHKLINLKITKGELNTTYKGFSFKLDGLKYSLQKKQIKAKDTKAEGTILGTTVTLTGENVSYGSKGFDFTKITATTGGEEITTMKVFTLKPEEFALLKEGDKYKAEAKGSVDLKLPSFLDIESDGSVKGSVGVDLDKVTEPYYNIDSASARVEAANPLSELASYLGGASSRYELSAGIPVFPGVSAVFGLFVAYGADFGKKLVGEVSYKDKELTINVEMGNFKAFVEAGVFGGIQAGSELLLALALLLVASGEIELNGNVGYKKSYRVGEKPQANKFEKGEDGITYNLQGAVKLGASLDIVATALYFFQKRFSIKLASATLGSIEIEKGKDIKFNKNSDSLAKKDQLDENVVKGKEEEAKQISVEQLLSLDQNYRFSSSEKKDTIKIIEQAEKGRAEQLTKEPKDEKGLTKFNNVPLVNLSQYNQFVSNRVKWERLWSTFKGLTIDPNATELSSSTSQELLDKLKKMGEDVNLASNFVEFYQKKITEFKNIYSTDIFDGNVKKYLDLLENKKKVLGELNKFKQDYLHSGFWGDESLQKGAIKTTSWFGDSNYKKFATDYNSLKGSFQTYGEALPPKTTLSDTAKEAGMELLQKYQRRVEKEAALKSS